MAKLFQYQSLAFVATLFPSVVVPGGAFPESPAVFAKPTLRAAQQQFGGEVITKRVADATTANNFNWADVVPEQFKPQFPSASQQFDASGWERSIPVAGTGQWFPQPPDVFAKPFPVAQQQFLARVDNTLQIAFVAEGWWGQQLDYKFAPRFPVQEQKFYPDFEPEGFVQSTFPDGWRGLQFEYKFKQPFLHQQFDAPFWFGLLPVKGTGQWFPQAPDVFKPTFSPAHQQFHTQVIAVPQFVPPPPGAGKRKNLPVGAPEPPYSVKPNKPFRPVWDHPRDGVVEPAKIPLPPASLFAAPAPPPAGLFASRSAPPPLSLPDFKQMVPPDPIGLDAHMRDVQDHADIMALLKSMGIVKDEG